jgi:hypothetical protein
MRAGTPALLTAFPKAGAALAVHPIATVEDFKILRRIGAVSVKVWLLRRRRLAQGFFHCSGSHIRWEGQTRIGLFRALRAARHLSFGADGDGNLEDNFSDHVISFLACVGLRCSDGIALYYCAKLQAMGITRWKPRLTCAAQTKPICFGDDRGDCKLGDWDHGRRYNRDCRESR